MKKLLITTAALSGMLAVPAHAANPQDVVFTGTRAIECTIENMDALIDFGDLGQRGQAARVSNRGIDVFCNQPSSVSFESLNGYLALETSNPANDSLSESDFTSAANPGFSAGLDYEAQIPAFAVSAETSGIDAGVAISIPGVPALNLNNIRINYDTVNESQPLLGGVYSDTLTITLTPSGV